MKKISLKQFRDNIRELSDQVITTGEPLCIEVKGQHLVLYLESKPKLSKGPKSKLSRLKSHKSIVGDPKELISFKLW